MDLSERSINALAYVISGNEVDRLKHPIAPYRSGPKLIAFFNEFGESDSYGPGFGSRFPFAVSKLRWFNGMDVMPSIVEAAFDPFHFEDGEKEIEPAVEYLNHYLKHDGYVVAPYRGKYKVRKVGNQLVEIEVGTVKADGVTQEFIDEQLDKCRRKLQDEDYDGAITNARSLVEATLLDIETKLTGFPPTPDGDLLKDYKRVQKLLNLEPSREDISNSLKQVLTGLSSIVAGIAPLRNRMSDSHARSYKPGRHHAKLVINAAQTLVDFLFETLAFQIRQGLVEIKSVKND